MTDAEHDNALVAAAALLLDELRDPPSVSVIDQGLDAAAEKHMEGDVGNANDCVEAFLASIAALSEET